MSKKRINVDPRSGAALGKNTSTTLDHLLYESGYNRREKKKNLIYDLAEFGAFSYRTLNYFNGIHIFKDLKRVPCTIVHGFFETC